MQNSFEEIKKTWHSVANNESSSFKELENEIFLLKKKRKKNIIFWSLSIMLFSLIVIGYVIYTDELNSIYKSISEFILLFTSIYLFWHLWKNITKQKNEFLLNSSDFVRSLSQKEGEKFDQPILIACISISLYLSSVLLYFFDDLLQSKNLLFLTICLLLLIFYFLWFVLKPIYTKKMRSENQKALNHLNKILTNINSKKK